MAAEKEKEKGTTRSIGKRKGNRKSKETKETPSSGSVTEHLFGQTELLEGSHRSLTHFAESQDKVTPTKPSPHVGGGRS